MQITVKLWLALVITGIIVLQILAMAKLFGENLRLADNMDAVMSGIQYNKTRDSLQTARTERLLLETHEIKRYFPEIAGNISRLDMKMRNLERYSAVTTNGNYNVSGRLRDTVFIKKHIYQERIILDTIRMQYMRYKDKWFDFQQAVVADSTYTSIQTKDSIHIAQSWERPNKLWFVRWGRKRHYQTVTNANPNSRITYSISVEKL